MDTFELAR